MKRDRLILIIGKCATILCILMYVAYIPQIMSNLQGNKVSPIQPAVAMLNAILWTIYGILQRDRPIVLSNFPGIIFGAATLITIYI